MLARLFLLFTLVPALEIYLLVLVGRQIGAGPTLAVVLVTGALGAALARREARRAWGRLQEGLARGIPPGQDIVSGLLVVVGGVLLLTPGFATDLAGLLCLLPLTRAPLARALTRWAVRHMVDGTLVVGGLRVGRGAAGPAARPPEAARRPPFDDRSFGGTWDPRTGTVKPRDDDDPEGSEPPTT